MHLYFFLLFVLSLSCASLPAVETSLGQSALATLCMLSGMILLCHIAARICSKQIEAEQIDPRLGAELIERQMTAFRWLGLGIVLLCLAGFGLATAPSQPRLRRWAIPLRWWRAIGPQRRAVPGEG